jgi:hypothetical protein
MTGNAQAASKAAWEYMNKKCDARVHWHESAGHVGAR